MEIKKKISFLMPFLYACEVVLNKILKCFFLKKNAILIYFLKKSKTKKVRPTKK